MQRKETLLQRLSDIGESLRQSQNALALLGFGSIGKEIERLDDYSDLDFIAVVKNGYKQKYINNLEWLEKAKPLTFVFMNTKDGFKVMYEDEIFCEFAVVETGDLEKIPHSEGRVIWKENGFDEKWCSTNDAGVTRWKPESVEWLIGEIITFIYVGLCRYYRGEKLSGYKFIQGQAFDMLIELLYLTKDKNRNVFEDMFSKERRFEKMYDGIDKTLERFLQGYSNTVASAREMIIYLDDNYNINSFMRDLILRICNNGFIYKSTN